jgi:hypothetical protein
MRLPTTAILVLGLGHAASAAPTLEVSPKPIVLGDAGQVSLTITGLDGEGAVQARANVGRVTSIHTAGATARLRYTPPEDTFPQILCLLLWREPGRAAVIRLPMLARTVLPVRTKPNAQVTLTVGDRVFGPRSSGRTGKFKISVVVPPGVSHYRAEAISRSGLATTKKVRIQQPPYNTLTLGVSPPAGKLPGARFRVVVASAVPTTQRPILSAAREGGGSTPLVVKPDGAGRWSGRWAPNAGGSWTVRATLPERPLSATAVAVAVEPPPKPKPKPRPKPRPRVARATPGFWGALRWTVGLTGGVMHNTGELMSPRFSLEGGADHTVGFGRLGVSLHLGLGWGGKEIALDGGPTAATVALVPIGVLAGYRVPLGRLAPFVAVGPLAQVVSYQSDGPDTGSVKRSSVAVGVLALVGTRLAVGPGALLIRGGYQHSRFDERDVTMLAGGVLIEAGYGVEL